MSRHYQEIIAELQAETHKDGYYGNKPGLERIVDELVGEMRYAGLLPEQPNNDNAAPPQTSELPKEEAV